MNARPKIVISTLDADRLESLMESFSESTFPGKAELEAELERAEIVEPKDVPPTVVSMNSTVRFRVQSSDEEFKLTLVYPKDMDSSGNKISILAPVGSALLGLSEGDQIEWPKPGGGFSARDDRGSRLSARAVKRVSPVMTRSNQELSNNAIQPTLVPCAADGRRYRAEKARRILRGESPRWVRASHPPVSSLGPVAECGVTNKAG